LRKGRERRKVNPLKGMQTAQDALSERRKVNPLKGMQTAQDALSERRKVNPLKGMQKAQDCALLGKSESLLFPRMETQTNTQDATRKAIENALGMNRPYSPAPLAFPERESGRTADMRAAMAERETLTLERMNAGASPMLRVMSNAVIFRLENPKQKAECGGTVTKASKARRKATSKAKAKLPLSMNDKLEVFQTCAMVLVARDEFHAERLSAGAWFAAFRACRAVLRMNHRKFSEVITATPADELADMQEAAHLGFDAEAVALARVRLARRVKYWHACASVAFHLSTNRKRKSIRKANLATLRAIAAGNFRISGMSQAELEKASRAKRVLFDAIAQGESAMDAEAQDAITEAQDARRKARALEVEASMIALW
jgi:hypothetical protein